ncbi:MAG: MBOAT family protein [Bacteroidetes bacterium]|nr:MBOAT family protein [Bacteroidota bacterium]
MVFSSPIFLFLFLPVTLLLAYLTQHHKWRNSVLLILSIFFYVFGEGELILLMFGSITLNYFIGRWIGTSQSKTPVVVGLILNLLILGVFKYASFVIENINFVLAHLELSPLKMVHIKLPVGISFYTFHAISYLLDVHRRQYKPQKSYVDLALYVCLFPQLVAGPIVRYKDIVLQLKDRYLSSHKFHLGLERFIMGLGKKVVIANSLGTCADLIFELNPNQLSTPTAWFGIICYSMQLYFDFSGYSDMAIGLGKMLGFDFLENFQFPYKSRSIREFWQRWHISLSNWFRDYLYIPLGGNRVSPGRIYLNLFIVFFLTGLWHGASWNFLIWGLLHGFFMILERLGLGRVLERSPKIIQHLYTLMVVVFAWVFFRADDLPNSTSFISSMIGINNFDGYTIDMFLNREVVFAFVAGIILSFNGFNWMLRKIFKSAKGSVKSNAVVKFVFVNGRTVFFLALFVYSALTVAGGSYNPFIYFRF